MNIAGNFNPPPEIIAEAIAFREAQKNSPDEWGASDLGDFDFQVWVEEPGQIKVTVYPVIRQGTFGSTDTSRWLTIGETT